jgi:methyl-accepting chemotaxis protein
MLSTLFSVNLKIKILVAYLFIIALLGATFSYNWISSEKVIKKYEQSLAGKTARDAPADVAQLKSEFAAAKAQSGLVTGVLAAVILLISFGVVSVSFLRPFKRLEEHVASMGRGDFAGRVDVDAMDEVGRISVGLNDASAVISTFIEKARDALKGIRDRDIACVAGLENLAGKAQGEDGLDVFVSEMTFVTRQLWEDIKVIQDALMTVSTELATVVGQVSEMGSATYGQHDELNEITRSLEENSSTVKLIAKTGEESREAVEGIVMKISNSTAQMTLLSDSIRDIQESTSEITNIATVIQDIADQTNLLALNAAIEAARAGEQGRGFAVVATEVKKLAESVGRATHNVISLVKQTEDRVKAGVVVVNQIVAANQEMENDSQTIKGGIDSLATAVAQQSASMENLKNSAIRVSGGADMINTTTAQITETVINMVDSMDRAAEVVNSYKL